MIDDSAVPPGLSRFWLYSRHSSAGLFSLRPAGTQNPDIGQRTADIGHENDIGH